MAKKTINWVRNHLEITPPKNPKKLTGTRFASVLGKNAWSTPFEIWCTVTRTYEEPFEDTKYTLAGKAIEPKQIAYVKDHYYLDVVTPTMLYGEDYFKTKRGDFFPDDKVFGGMWDALSMGDDGKIDAVLEMKTTKRSEDWEEGAPEYYSLQASLYAHLLGCDKVIMVCSFLKDGDYGVPESYICTPDNTIIDEFLVSERFPNLEGMLTEASTWYHHYVLGGVSPDYDDVADKGILNALRKVSLNPDTDIKDAFEELNDLQLKLDENAKTIAPLEKRYKEVSQLVRDYMLNSMRDSDTKAEVTTPDYVWTLSKSQTTTVNKEALQADGLLDKYQTVNESTRFTKKAR